MTTAIIDSHPTKLTPSVPRLVYLHIGFANTTCADYASAIAEDAKFVLDLCESWQSLITSIAKEVPQAVLIHINALQVGPGSVADISTMLNIVLAMCATDVSHRVGVVVDNLVDITFVKELKKNNILNIVPSVEFLGIEESSKAIIALLADEPHVLNVVGPESTLPKVVSFRTSQQEQCTSTVQYRIKHNGKYRIEFCTSWDAFTESISEPTDLILLHCKMLVMNNIPATEVVNMISSISHYTTGKMAKIAVVIDKDTSVEQIKELRTTDICGIVPSSEQWGTAIGNAAVVAILTEGANWPKDIISALPGNIAKPVSATNSFHLTIRQKQIVDLICTRGLSNKRIASTLHIAESTVKIHVSAVLKVYGVRTRTQLALVGNK